MPNLPISNNELLIPYHHYPVGGLVRPCLPSQQQQPLCDLRCGSFLLRASAAIGRLAPRRLSSLTLPRQLCLWRLAPLCQDTSPLHDTQPQLLQYLHLYLLRVNIQCQSLHCPLLLGTLSMMRTSIKMVFGCLLLD